ncbi:MAG: serine dehydratase beta chain, partial [Bifidobacteriaceae bacterium]|nr:serine dehydratase beta chain [Bifidobacteriaceae bacterium]
MDSILEMFSIGIGPSSSHTVGPMKAANSFIHHCEDQQVLQSISRIQVVLYGSLSLTGLGHGTDRAIIAGLEGYTPETVDTDYVLHIVEEKTLTKVLHAVQSYDIDFDYHRDIQFDKWQRLAFHPNGMRFIAYNGENICCEEVWYSTGDGFIQQGLVDDEVIANHAVKHVQKYHQQRRRGLGDLP